MTLFAELKRRNVFRVSIAYIITAWLILQLADIVLDNTQAPAWVMQVIMLLLVIGFPFSLLFAWAFEMTPEGIKKEKDVDRSRSITKVTGRKLDFAIIAVLTAALGYFAWDKYTAYDNPVIPVSESSADEAAPAAPPQKSIAVLPFVNMSDDASNEYFSDGISEEILNALAKVKQLQVAGRTSSFAFKGKNQDLRQIGKALGVDHILEGSVRKAGGMVRITAQLVRVDNGFHMWSERYDRELTDVFAIQDEIANAILVQLKAQLIGEEQQAVAATRTNAEVYDLYLLARQRMYERSRLPLEAAASLLDRAIALDPDYAPAYAQRGITTLLLADDSYGTIPAAQAETQARLHLDQALRLDPELAEGWAGLGLYHEKRPGEQAEAITVLEKALAINPGLIDAANWLNNAYTRTNQPAKSIRILEDLMQRDPLYKPGLGNLAFLYVQTGQLEKASALIEKARPFLSQDANMLSLDAMMKSTEGEIGAALALAEEATRRHPEDWAYRTSMSFALLETHQYERLAEEGYWFVKIIGLRHLGRVEEASILAHEWAAQGKFEGLFAFLNATGQFTELIRYLEERWPDLSDFEQDFPSNGYFGYGQMINIALAYRRAGEQERFNDAMVRIRTAHDSLAAQGLSNTDFFLNEAAYYAMAGDRGLALMQLGAAIDGGRILAARISDDLPYFSGFEGDPEYEAIQSRMVEHLNRERVKLGLRPIST